MKDSGASGAAEAIEFLGSKVKGQDRPKKPFLGQSLRNRDERERICDCCSGPGGDPQDDCCGFNPPGRDSGHGDR